MIGCFCNGLFFHWLEARAAEEVRAGGLELGLELSQDCEKVLRESGSFK